MRTALADKIFLLDGLGAALSAVFLGVVLVRLEKFIGMPPSTLYALAGLALLLSAYSLSCHFFVTADRKNLLRIIIAANLLYCLLTFILMLAHRADLTVWAWTYFILEILVILAIVRLERQVLGEL
jgi:hypothetical protein